MTEAAASPGSVEQMYDYVSLSDVTFTDFSATIVDDDLPTSVDVAAASTVTSENYTIRISVDAIGYGARYSVTAEVIYDTTGTLDIADDVERDFVNESALVTLTPFLREALVSLGKRISRPAPIFPLQGPHSPLSMELMLDRG